MVEDIYKLKNKILQYVERETQDMGRINVKEVGELVDMVKDLAEAEKCCWEASYYRSVTEAMENGSSGYGSMGYGSQAGGQQSRSGYGSQSMRSGYDSTGSMGHGNIIEALGEEYRNLNPDERMRMKNQVLSTLGTM